MRKVSKLLLGLALLQGSAFADEPKIEVIDGKISITANAVALGRFLTLFDKAMGLKSEVKPELANQNVSVQFTDLNFNDAVRKIFQGQPLNYVVVQGKGIRVMGGPADRGGSSGVADSQPFSSSSQPIINTPINNSLPQQLNPQPQPANSNIFGAPTPAANANANAPANPSAPLSSPGMIPPPLGTNVPVNNPFGGANTGGNILPNQGVPAAPAAPPPPGVLPGAAPGATPGTIK